MAGSISGQIGPQFLVDGESAPVRQGIDAQLITSPLHGRYFEQSRRANIFTGENAFAGNSISSSQPFSGQVTPTMALWNPPNSGINVSIIRTQIYSINGTPGAGAWVYVMGSDKKIAISVADNHNSASGASPVCTNGGWARGRAKFFINTTLTGSASPWFNLRPIGAMFAAATAATSTANTLVDYPDGDIVLQPSNILLVAPPATGTSHIVVVNLIWEEISL